MKILWLPLLLMAQNTMAQKPGIITVRNLFVHAAYDEDSASKLVMLLNGADSHVPLWVGYKGATYIVMVKHEKNPISKWKDFKQGKKMLEKAIREDTENYELRFIRYCIQTNLPKFLSYDDDIGKDKTILMNGLYNLQDADLKKRVVAYLRNGSSGH